MSKKETAKFIAQIIVSIASAILTAPKNPRLRSRISLFLKRHTIKVNIRDCPDCP